MIEFHHIGYLVKDLKGAIQAFKYIGYDIERECMYDNIRDADIVFLSNLGFGMIELIYPHKNSGLNTLWKHYKNRPYHICMEVDSIDRVSVELESGGYMIIREKELAPCLNDGHVLFLINPFIGMIELFEPREGIRN